LKVSQPPKISTWAHTKAMLPQKRATKAARWSAMLRFASDDCSSLRMGLHVLLGELFGGRGVAAAMVRSSGVGGVVFHAGCSMARLVGLRKLSNPSHPQPVDWV
jgi:hypothetical protein